MHPQPRLPSELLQPSHAFAWLTAAKFEEDRTVLDAAGGLLLPGDKLCPAPPPCSSRVDIRNPAPGSCRHAPNSFPLTSFRMRVHCRRRPRDARTTFFSARTTSIPQGAPFSFRSHFRFAHCRDLGSSSDRVSQGQPLSAVPMLWERQRAVMEPGGGRLPRHSPLGGGTPPWPRQGRGSAP